MIKFDTVYLNITALRSAISVAKDERDLLLLHGCNGHAIDTDVITNDLYRNRMIAIKQAAKKTHGRVPSNSEGTEGGHVYHFPVTDQPL